MQSQQPVVEDYIEAKLPDYQGECTLAIQLCLLAGLFWLLLLPSLLSRPADPSTNGTNDEKPNQQEGGVVVVVKQGHHLASTGKSQATRGKKGNTKKRVRARKSSNDTSNDSKVSQQGEDTHSSVPRYIPLWVNVACLVCFCCSTVYILLTKSPYNYYTPRRVFEAPLLTREECQHVIDMATRAAERNVINFKANNNNTNNNIKTDASNQTDDSLLAEPVGWQKTRHKSYPTTDLNLVTDPFTKDDRAWLSDILNKRLAPSLERFYGVPSASIRMNDMFVVRYDAGKRAHLTKHTDDAFISFNVLLTDDFEGGGTRFWNRHLQQPFAHVQPTEVGTVLVHGAQIKHEGMAVTKGSRMILVGFTNIDRSDPWTGQSTGLGWLASWLSMAWTHIRCKAGYKSSASRAFRGNVENVNFYDNQFFRLMFRDLIVLLESFGDRISTHTVTRIVHPTNATACFRALDAEYQAKGQYRRKANWFKGQQVQLEVDGTVAREWYTRTAHESRFEEL